MSEQSYTNIPNNVLEFLYNGELSRTAIKLYLFLRRYKNNKTEKAWPSRTRIKNEVSISPRDIKTARQELIDAQLITTSRGKNNSIEIEFNDEVVITMITTSSNQYDNHSSNHSDTPINTNITTNNKTTNITPAASEQLIKLDEIFEAPSSVMELKTTTAGSNHSDNHLNDWDEGVARAKEKWLKDLEARKNVKSNIYINNPL